MTVEITLGPVTTVAATAGLDEGFPKIAVLPNGDYAVAWMATIYGSTSDSTQSYFRIFNADGTPATNPIQVGSGQYSDNPSISLLSNGNLVVSWNSPNNNEYEYQIFNQAGDAVTTPRIDVASNWGGFPAGIGELANGNFALIAPDAPGEDIGVYNANGTLIGAHKQAESNSNIQYDINVASILPLPGGGFALAWSAGQAVPEAYADRVRFRVFDANGNPVSSEYESSLGYTGGVPKSTLLADGRILVLWTDTSTTTSSSSVAGQYFDQSGNALGAAFELSLSTGSSSGLVSVQALTNGGFLLLYGSGQQASDIYAQVFDATGTAQGKPVEVDSGYNTTYGEFADAKLLPDGNVLVAWDGNDSGTDGSIYSRIISIGSSNPASAPYDFNGDGFSDILFRNTSSGETYLWEMNGATVTNGAPTSTQVGENWQIEGVGDFNGDGTADLLWVYNNSSNAADPLNGVSYITFQNGATATSQSGVVQQLSSQWQVQGVGDFTGDGVADVLYRYENASNASDPLNGQTYIDIMNGLQVTSASGFTSQQVTNPNWQVAAIGDFSGNGQSDILWQYDNASNASDPLNGDLYMWAMNGTNVASAGLLSQQAGSANWQVEGTGDFDGNGTADILFRYENSADASDPLNGLTYIDFMNGSTVTSGAPTQWQIDNSWIVAGIGDYNGDGKSDILWQQSSTGDTYIWEMNGANVTNGAFTSQQAGTGWTVQNGAHIG